MKTALTIFLITFLINNPEEIIHKVTFSSGTRGFHETVIVRKDSSFYTKESLNGNKNWSISTPPDFWNKITESVLVNELPKLVKLHSPTNNRASDAAMYSELVFNTNVSEYRTENFDNYTPNRKLQPLMDALLILLRDQK